MGLTAAAAVPAAAIPIAGLSVAVGLLLGRMHRRAARLPAPAGPAAATSCPSPR
jgi:hypothetical protein